MSARNSEFDSDADEDASEFDCKQCNLKFEKLQAYNLHLQSMAHIQKTLEGESQGSNVKTCSGRSLCDICGFAFSGEKAYKMHLKEEIHLKRLEMIKEAHVRKEMMEEEVKLEKEACQRKIVNHLKGRIPDEDFEEFNPDSNELYCKLCDVSCYGMIPFKMHLDGAKHKKKLERKGLDGSVKIDDLDRTVEELIDDCREPLIGLEYVREYDDEEGFHDYRYLCELCDTKLITSQIIHHLTGLTHRHKYYKIHDPRIYEFLWNLVPRSLKSAKARECAKKTEAKIGRKNIRYVGESPSYDAEDLERYFPKGRDFSRPAPYHSPGYGYRTYSVESRVESRKPDLKLIEKGIDRCNFDYESHIEAAIHITNVLVEALLKDKQTKLKRGETDEELENKIKNLKRARSVLDLSSITDPALSDAIHEAKKLAKEIIQGDGSLLGVTNSFLDTLDNKLLFYMEKESNRKGSGDGADDAKDSGHSNVGRPSKKFKFGL